MKKPPIGTPPREASERRLAEEQAKRGDLDTQIIRELSDRVVDLERDAGMLAAEIDRLLAALREARADAQHYMANGAEAIRELATLRAGVDKAREILAKGKYSGRVHPNSTIDAALSELDALSGKGES